jgi:hypothetical protein
MVIVSLVSYRIVFIIIPAAPGRPAGLVGQTTTRLELEEISCTACGDSEPYGSRILLLSSN